MQEDRMRTHLTAQVRSVDDMVTGLRVLVDPEDQMHTRLVHGLVYETYPEGRQFVSVDVRSRSASPEHEMYGRGGAKWNGYRPQALQSVKAFPGENAEYRLTFTHRQDGRYFVTYTAPPHYHPVLVIESGGKTEIQRNEHAEDTSALAFFLMICKPTEVTGQIVDPWAFAERLHNTCRCVLDPKKFPVRSIEQDPRLAGWPSTAEQLGIFGRQYGLGNYNDFLRVSLFPPEAKAF